MRNALVLLALWLPLVSTGATISQETAGSPPQTPDPFSDALARAKAERKYLFVAVYADGNPDCAKFDQTVLGNDRVQRWMEHRAVLLKIDLNHPSAERFAAEHRIEKTPTLLILASDGRELGRQIGLTPPGRFLIKVNGSIQSKAIHGEPGIRSWAGQDVVLNIMQRAATLTAQQQYQQALREYVWCLNRRATHSPIFPVVHLNDLVTGVVELAKVYEPAKTELDLRIGEAEVGSLRARRPDVYAFYFIKYYYLAMNDEDRLVQHYDRLRRRWPDSSNPDMFARLIYGPLLHGRRYEDLQVTVDEPADVDLFLDESASLRRDRGEVRSLLAGRYEILLGLDRTAEAKEVARKLLAFDDSAQTYLELAEAALRSGRASDEHLMQAQRAHHLTHGRNARAVMVLARILAQRTPGDSQAVALLQAAMKDLTAKPDQQALAECLREIQPQNRTTPSTDPAEHSKP